MAALVLAGAVAVLAPWLARNYDLSGQARLAGGNSASLYASAMQYKGELGYAFDRAELDKLREATEPYVKQAHGDTTVEREIAVEEKLGPAARDKLGTVSPGDVLRTLPKRVAYLWGVSDYPQVGGYSVWHRIAQLEHILLLALAAVGCWFAVRDLRRFWPLLVYPVFITCAHLVAHAEARYSVPARPALFGLAALAVARTLPAGRLQGLPRWRGKASHGAELSATAHR